MSIKTFAGKLIVCAGLVLCSPAFGQMKPASSKAPDVIQPADLQQLVPPAVYFSGQTATSQVRNSGGVRWAQGKQTLFFEVDTAGYSSAVRDRYQFYILTDTPVELSRHLLQPGAYGAGFVEKPGLVVMDLGGNELFHTPYTADSELKRPRPLQVTAGQASGEYRLYLGRNYVTFKAK
jgi:hypothetical protein